MSRLLFRLSYTAFKGCTALAGRALPRAPIRNRTVDLLLTMETLCRLSYWGVFLPAHVNTATTTVHNLEAIRATARNTGPAVTGPG
jgi:hypothetical protein